MQDIINLIGTIGVGTLIGTVFTAYFSGRQANKERKYQLEKELFFALQMRAIEVLESVYKFDEVFKRMQTDIKVTKSSLYEELDSDWLKEFGANRIKLISYIKIYFPECRTSYRTVTNSFKPMKEMYQDLAVKVKGGMTLSDGELSQFDILADNYESAQAKLINEVASIVTSRENALRDINNKKKFRFVFEDPKPEK